MARRSFVVGTDENSFSASWRLMRDELLDGIAFVGDCFWIICSGFAVELRLREMEEEGGDEEVAELRGLEKK